MIASALISSIPVGFRTLSQVRSGISEFTNLKNALVVNVKPFGTLTPDLDNFWNISPNDAPLPPTLWVSSIVVSWNHFVRGPDSIETHWSAERLMTCYHAEAKLRFPCCLVRFTIMLIQFAAVQ